MLSLAKAINSPKLSKIILINFNVKSSKLVKRLLFFYIYKFNAFQYIFLLICSDTINVFKKKTKNFEKIAK